jgi:uncharacterized protein (DUF58 family)
MGAGWRISSVFIPSFIAVMLAIRAQTAHVSVAGHVLAGLWIAMAVVLWMRYRQARRADRSPIYAHAWEHLDVLSATGRATAWTALVAVALAIKTGWASLSVLGILGLGIVLVATTWTALAAGGDAPWRDAKITRAIVPDVAIEGEPLREQLKLDGVRIPMAMRLFASGKPLKHGYTTRYAVGSDGSSAALELQAELGPAPRGEHHAPSMKLWLGDVLGLTRTAPVERGEVTFTVLPRPAKVGNARALLGGGRDDVKSRDTIKMPTEGTFRIREYVPGDDTRRIHWVRSLQADQLVVRLPDEIPPADPQVRLVLDNHFADTDRFTCRAPDELLDSMVRVWLGIGKALSETGVRVTLVTGMERGGSYVKTERPLLGRASGDANKLGARVAWQPKVRLDMLLDKPGARQIVVTCRPRVYSTKAEDPSVEWVVVPHNEWTTAETWPAPASSLVLPFPAGSAENRRDRRRAEQQKLIASWQSRILFGRLCAVDWRAFSGSFVARPAGDAVTLQVIP